MGIFRRPNLAKLMSIKEIKRGFLLPNWMPICWITCQKPDSGWRVLGKIQSYYFKVTRFSLQGTTVLYLVLSTHVPFFVLP